MEHLFMEHQFDDINHLNGLINNKRVLLADNMVIEALGMQKTNLRSEVWKYFGMAYYAPPFQQKRQIASDYRFCVPCFQKFKLGEKADIAMYRFKTSNQVLAEHLYNAHTVTITKCRTPSSARTTQTTPSREQSEQPSVKEFTTDCPVQQSHSFSSQITPRSIPRQNSMLDAVSDLYLRSSNLTLKFLSSKPFQEYSNRLSNKNVFIPSEATIRKNVLKRYKSFRQTAISYIRTTAPEVVSIIFDLWSESSGYKRSFLNIQLQFSRNFEVRNINLQTKEFNKEKSGENLASEIFELLKEFNLTDKYIVMVTDQGGNVLKCIKVLLERYHIKGISIPCAAHILHNVVKDILKKEKAENDIDLKYVCDTISKVKSIHNTLCYRLKEVKDKTQQYKTMMGLKMLTHNIDNYDGFIECLRDTSQILQNSNATRWSSIYTMLNSYYLNRDAIAVTLIEIGKKQLQITPMEDCLIEDLIKILKCFKEPSKCLQGSTYGTLYMVIFSNIMIRRALNEFQQESEFVESDVVTKNLLDGLDARFKIKDHHKVAGILNPSLNQLIELTLELKSKLLFDCFRKFGLLDNIYGSTTSHASKTTKSTPECSYINKQLEKLLNKTTSNRSECSPEANIKREIRTYLEMENECILEMKTFWIENKNLFPNLFNLADMIYGIPATSASSESNFSITGFVLNHRNCRLKSDLVEAKVFSSSNYEFFISIGEISEPIKSGRTKRNIRPRFSERSKRIKVSLVDILDLEESDNNEGTAENNEAAIDSSSDEGSVFDSSDDESGEY